MLRQMLGSGRKVVTQQNEVDDDDSGDSAEENEKDQPWCRKLEHMHIDSCRG